MVGHVDTSVQIKRSAVRVTEGSACALRIFVADISKHARVGEVHADASVRVVAFIALIRRALVVPVTPFIVGNVSVAEVVFTLEVRTLCTRVNVNSSIVVCNRTVCGEVILTSNGVARHLVRIAVHAGIRGRVVPKWNRPV